jgi:hypothetical protein
MTFPVFPNMPASWRRRLMQNAGERRVLLLIRMEKGSCIPSRFQRHTLSFRNCLRQFSCSGSGTSNLSKPTIPQLRPPPQLVRDRSPVLEDDRLEPHRVHAAGDAAGRCNYRSWQNQAFDHSPPAGNLLTQEQTLFCLSGFGSCGPYKLSTRISLGCGVAAADPVRNK